MDPYQGPIFTELLVDDREESSLLDHIYRFSAGKREDYINPIVHGSISWIIIRNTKVSSEVEWNDW